VSGELTHCSTPRALPRCWTSAAPALPVLEVQGQQPAREVAAAEPAGAHSGLLGHQESGVSYPPLEAWSAITDPSGVVNFQKERPTLMPEELLASAIASGFHRTIKKAIAATRGRCPEASRAIRVS
jgi:hypothetical protein